MPRTARSLQRRASFQACHAARPRSRIGTTVTRPVMIRSIVSWSLGLIAVAGRPRMPGLTWAAPPPAAERPWSSDIGSAPRAPEKCGPDEEQHRSPHQEEPGLLGTVGDGRETQQQADPAAPGADLGAVRRVHAVQIPPKPGYSRFDSASEDQVKIPVPGKAARNRRMRGRPALPSAIAIVEDRRDTPVRARGALALCLL